MTTVLNKNQAKVKEETTSQPVTVDVTPVFGNGAVCAIAPGDGPSHSFVHGGIIRLRGNQQFQVTFQLPASTTPPPYQFDQSNPIWSSQVGCPPGSCQDGQITNPSVAANGTALSVTVTPDQGNQNAVHVSLGFSNGVRCDPIIINN